LYLPSQQASIPSVVGKELLASANSIFLLTQQFSVLLGFGFGGLLLGILGHDVTIVLSAVFLGMAAISVFWLPKGLFKDKAASLSWHAYFLELKKGYQFLRDNRPVMYPLGMIAFAQVFITIIAVILPTYARNVLGANINVVAVSFIVPGAIGALTFTYLLPRLLKKYRKKIIIETGLIIATISLFGLAILSHFGQFMYPVAVLIAIGVGTSIACVMVPAQTLLQEKTPEWFRGRVYASLNFLLIVTTIGPLLISAIVADILGVSVMIATVATIVLMGLIFVHKKGDYVLANGFGI